MHCWARSQFPVWENQTVIAVRYDFGHFGILTSDCVGQTCLFISRSALLECASPRTSHHHSITGLKDFQAQLKHFLFEHFNDFMIQCNLYTTEHVSFSQPSYTSGTMSRFPFIWIFFRKLTTYNFYVCWPSYLCVRIFLCVHVWWGSLTVSAVATFFR